MKSGDTPLLSTRFPVIRVGRYSKGIESKSKYRWLKNPQQFDSFKYRRTTSLHTTKFRPRATTLTVGWHPLAKWGTHSSSSFAAAAWTLRRRPPRCPAPLPPPRRRGSGAAWCRRPSCRPRRRPRPRSWWCFPARRRPGSGTWSAPRDGGCRPQTPGPTLKRTRRGHFLISSVAWAKKQGQGWCWWCRKGRNKL